MFWSGSSSFKLGINESIFSSGISVSLISLRYSIVSANFTTLSNALFPLTDISFSSVGLSAISSIAFSSTGTLIIGCTDISSGFSISDSVSFSSDGVSTIGCSDTSSVFSIIASVTLSSPET